MNHLERREEILRMLREEGGYINASEFASHFGVTRQIIVSDIALLRANGHQIQAARKGYRMEDRDSGLICSVMCRHSSEQVLDEFYAVVDNGGSVVSVVVEHPIYGQICADLNIDSRYDAQEFVSRMQSAKASQLSDLTGGFHIHMLRVPDEACFVRITKALRALKILAEAGDE